MADGFFTAYVLEREGVSSTVVDVRRSVLKGGHVAWQVERLDAMFDDGVVRSFVRKSTHPVEIAVMRLIRPFARDLPVPALVTDGRNGSGPWMVVPFIEGASLAGQLVLQLPRHAPETHSHS